LFRFTIRELVLLTLVVAMGVAWWMDRSHLSDQNRTLRDEHATLRLDALRANELGGRIIFHPAPLPRR
jgi:hypothetical protein